MAKILRFIDDYFIVIVLGVTLLVLFSVVLIPTIYVFLLSLFEVAISGEMRFIGLGNFGRALSDPEFWQFTYQTLIYAGGSVSISFLIAFICALALNRLRYLKGILRSLILLPWVIPPAIAGLIWRWMLNDTNGIVNDLLVNRLGIVAENILFLGRTSWARLSVVVADSWTRIPFMAILLLAGLQSISQVYYESAKVDGANWFQQLTKITVPLMRSTILVTLMIVTMLILRTYSIIFVITDGGPADTTQVLTTYIYNNTVRYWELGYGSALSVILLIIVVLITLYYTRQLVRKSIEY
ncbi:MAG: sugar ABC transporter permease [Spirochaetales bacterium]|nr:sugar ABC transporter permease [Spirochaetales bacterium]